MSTTAAPSAAELPRASQHGLLQIKPESQRALDWATFFLADVVDGLGPFLVIFLTSTRGWTAGEAGAAMAAMLLGTICTQTFVGVWIDQLQAKRWAIVGAALVVAICSLLMFYFPDRNTIFAVQFATGVAVTVFPPAIAAISLGLVGRAWLPARIGRNEGFNHAGNVAAAGVAAAAVWLVGSGGIFYGVAGMALASAFATLFIREADIDHRLARGADDSDGSTHIVPWSTVLKNRQVLWFLTAVVLFHFANAAMLPLVGQKVAARNASNASTLMAACIIVAQLVMVPVALAAGRAVCRWGRRPVFLLGFAVLPVRGLLYTLTDNPGWLIANQVLDGIGAGIFGVTAVLVVADLTHGSGRFNFLQGFMATAVGLGAAASNLATGLIADAAGYNAGFVFLAVIAAAAVAVFAWFVPETGSLSPDACRRE